jgi:hypothetical protein
MPAMRVVALALLAACATSPGRARVAFERLDDRVRIALDGEPLCEYRFRGLPVPVIGPLHGPDGGTVTRTWPLGDDVPGESRDHPHHRSLWFAHGAVGGHDFWSSAHGERIEHERFVDPPADRAHSALASTNRWVLADGTVVCRDERELAFGADVDGARFVDWTVTLCAGDAPLVLGDTKEGTMALRTADWLRVEGEGARGTLCDSEGRTGRAVWGKSARWVDVSARRDPARADSVVGIAIFDHPANPRHPTTWHARTYGLVAANPFGAHEFGGAPLGTGDLTVPAGGRITFRYRLWLHRGGAGDGVEAAWQRFAAAAHPQEARSR